MMQKLHKQYESVIIGERKNIKLLTLFTSTNRGGAEEYSLKIASAAHRAGWTVYASFPRVAGTNSLIEDFISTGIKYKELNILDEDVFLSSKKMLVHNYFQTMMVLLSIKPDVVHLQIPWPYKGLSSILACATLKTPALVVFQSFPFTIPTSRRKRILYNWARNRAQLWVAVSENNKLSLCKSFGIKPEKVKLIYNGVRLERSLSDKEKARSAILSELQLSEECLILLTVGRLDIQKGYQDIIAIAPYVISEYPKSKFVWVGEGHHKQFLITKIREAGLEKNIFTLGYRTDVYKLLQACDYFLFPSYFEGFPFALLEAMAVGVPIIASDFPSITEILKHGVHGLIHRTKDSSDLLEKLRWALSHPKEMREMAARARDLSSNFSEDRMIRETMDVLTELASGGGMSREK